MILPIICPLLTPSLEIQLSTNTLLVNGLVLKAHVNQYILRHNVIVKVDDCINITHLLSIVTYFYMTHTQFNVAHFLICYIENVTIVRNIKSKQKYNLALRHMIA